nr:DNA helicase [Tanacetum cinerariifolium]
MKMVSVPDWMTFPTVYGHRFCAVKQNRIDWKTCGLPKEIYQKQKKKNYQHSLTGSSMWEMEQLVCQVMSMLPGYTTTYTSHDKAMPHGHDGGEVELLYPTKMSYIHPAAGDLFYQRMLLSHQRGCWSFRDIRTVNYIVYPTCRAACEAMGLRETTQNGKLENYTKYELEACLNHYSRSLTDFGIPLPPEDLMSVLWNRLLMEEKSYDRQLLEVERDKLIHKLNNCQRNILDLIVNVVATGIQELIFVYDRGGTGKTFLWKTIICALRAVRKIVLAVASFGIASLLLPSGRTAHSRFKLPLEINDSSTCSITKNTQLAVLLKETYLIIWDESPINDRRCFEMLDRTLRDILNTPNKLFGGKSVMLGGNFRQTLPVKKKASQKMRLTQRNLSEAEKEEVSTFADWLLNVGDGTVYRYL